MAITPIEEICVYSEGNSLNIPDHIEKKESLESLMADVDVVDICTPTHTHYDLVMQSINAGKDVICEKPLARTVAEAQTMVDASENAGINLLVAHVVPLFP